MKLKNKLASVVLFTLLAFYTDAHSVCTVTATAVTFPPYDIFAATDTDSTGVISVSCDVRTNVTLEIGVSLHSSGFNPRQMKHSSLPDLLNYNLFTKNNRTTIWGDATGGTDTILTRVPNNGSKNVTVYGRIPALQSVAAGSYSDSLIVTFTP